MRVVVSGTQRAHVARAQARVLRHNFKPFAEEPWLKNPRQSQNG